MPAFQSFFTDHGDHFMPFPENTPTPDDLPSLSAAEIAALPVELLAILQREIDERLKRDKAAKARFDAGLAVRYASRAAEERQVSGKDTGTVHFDDDGIRVTSDLPKKAVWDQTKLAEMAKRIAANGDEPAQYLEITYKVAERKYTAWPEHLRSQFAPARTLKTGKSTFKLTSTQESTHV